MGKADRRAEVLTVLRRLLRGFGVSEADAERLPESENLVKNGWLDSLGMIGFVLRAEKELKLRIPVGRVEYSELSSLGAVADLLCRIERM